MRLLVMLFAVLALANADSGFIFPPAEGVNIPPTTPVTIRWTSNATDSSYGVGLAIWQDADQSSQYQGYLLAQGSRDTGTYLWTPASISGLSLVNCFHLLLTWGDGFSINSGALCIRDWANATTTSSSQQPAVISTATAPPSFTQSSSTLRMSTLPSTTSSASLSLASATSLATPVRDSSSNDTLRVGLGVGLGIGIPFLLVVGALAGYVLFRHRSRAGRGVQNAVGERRRAELGSRDGYPEYPENALSGTSSKQAMHEEFRGEGWRHELMERS